MKTNQLNIMLENIISSEVKKRIISEMEENKKEYHHIMCDGEPVETFHSKEEAESHLDKWKKDHPGKQFIIEKGDYESDDDMLDKLDEMSDNLEKNNENMEKPKITSLAEAVLYAKEKGIKRFRINEDVYDTDECWKNMEEEEEFSDGNYLNDMYEDDECDECGGSQMDEMWDEDEPSQIKGLGFNQDGDPYGFDYEDDLSEPEECHTCGGFGQHEDGETCQTCGGEGTIGGNPYVKEPSTLKDFEGHKDFTLDDEIDEEECDECWGNQMDEEDFEMNEDDLDFEDFEDRYPDEEDPEHFELNVPKECSHCHGTGVNQYGSPCKKCKGHKFSTDIDKFSSHFKSPRQHHHDITSRLGEPSLNENKKIIRLTESQFVDAIKQIVKESIPGLSTAKRAKEESGKENNQHIKDVDKKMKDYLSFEGNDNPEFPHHIGKGKNTKEVVKINNTDEENEYVEDNRGMGLQDVKYDHEPSEKFKERVKKALEGDSTMGNSQDSPNVIKTKTGENIGKIAKRKKKEIEDQPMYKKDIQPVKMVKESVEKNVIIESEIDKMKKLFSYNKKTQ